MNRLLFKDISLFSCTHGCICQLCIIKEIDDDDEVDTVPMSTSSNLPAIQHASDRKQKAWNFDDM